MKLITALLIGFVTAPAFAQVATAPAQPLDNNPPAPLIVYLALCHDDDHVDPDTVPSTMKIGIPTMSRNAVVHLLSGRSG